MAHVRRRLACGRLGFGALPRRTIRSGTITIVVPFSAGGPTDTVTRLIAESMSQTLGQQIIVENVGGAGGTLGARRVAQAEPDGYTLLVHHIGMATSATLYRNLPYDPLSAFAPSASITEVPMTLVGAARISSGRPTSRAGRATRRRTRIRSSMPTPASAPPRSSAACSSCRRSTRQLTTVPYKGTGPAMTDLMGGQVDFMCDQTTNTTNPIKARQHQGLRRTSPRSAWTCCPTCRPPTEAGLEGIEIAIWHGLYAPAGNAGGGRRQAVGGAQVGARRRERRARFAELGTAPVRPKPPRPQALQDKLVSEIDRWKPVIEAAGVYAE